MHHACAGSTRIPDRDLKTGTVASGARGRTCTMAGANLDTRQQRVALRRIGAPGQHVLQRGRQLVAVQGHDPVVVVACVPHPVSTCGRHRPELASACMAQTMAQHTHSAELPLRHMTADAGERRGWSG